MRWPAYPSPPFGPVEILAVGIWVVVGRPFGLLTVFTQEWGP